MHKFTFLRFSGIPNFPTLNQAVETVREETEENAKEQRRDLEELIFDQIHRLESRMDRMTDEMHQIENSVTTQMTNLHNTVESMTQTNSKVTTDIQKLQTAVARMANNNDQQSCKYRWPIKLFSGMNETVFLRRCFFYFEPSY